MDLLANVFSDLWNGLSNLTVPIINISFTKFLLAVFVAAVIVEGINVLLDKKDGSSDGKL